MSVPSVGSSLSIGVAALSTSQAAQQVNLAASVAVLKMAQEAERAIVDLVTQALGVGQNIDLLA